MRITEKGLLTRGMMGKKHSEATKQKIKENLAGNKNSLGYKHTKEQRINNSIGHKGQVAWNKNKKTISCVQCKEFFLVSPYRENQAKFCSVECKGTSQLDKTPWNFGLGMASEELRLRWSKEYVAWRKSVFERDDYTCQKCSVRGKKLNADHIKPFSLYPSLRLSLDNGRTLCVDCHKKTDTYGGRAKKIKVFIS